MSLFNRRDFLKIMSALPLSGLVSSFAKRKKNTSANSQPGVIIIVMDALTARNMSLYGYSRRTTPNIERLAARANVYHDHHSAGTFTTSGTASLLTGTYPWTHRAVNFGSMVAREKHHNNIFSHFDKSYKKICFTQNYFANYILSQFSDEIDTYFPPGTFSKYEDFFDHTNYKDYQNIVRVEGNFFIESGNLRSLIFGGAKKIKRKLLHEKLLLDEDLQYFDDDLYYYIQDVYKGLASVVTQLSFPSLCYFHLYPPHEPYRPQKKFTRLFNDNFKPVEKPRNQLNRFNTEMQDELNKQRLLYDQFLATSDSAFGIFLDELEKNNIFDNNYIVFTADHGESFERGYLAHSGPYVYETSIQIPLLISSPGQKERRDFFTPTNSVDVLPTLLNVTRQDIPDWCEGKVLPGFTDEPVDEKRVTFSMDAKESSSFKELTPITITMRQGKYKIIYYAGYRLNAKKNPYRLGTFELYNLEDDPEELYDLIDIEKDKTEELKALLLSEYRENSNPK